MADHASAVKRIRQNKKRRERNASRHAELKTALKKVSMAVQAKDKTKAKEALSLAISLLDKAAQSSLLHWKNAGRKISRLTGQVNSL
jgi:small subunit ribosomal protein S20